MVVNNSKVDSKTDFLFIKAATIYPPIAYAYLAPHLENLGLNVSIIDLVVDVIDDEALKIILIQKEPKYVGIKCLSFASHLSFNAAKIVKATLPECVVIFGGHHVTALPQETLAHPCVDFVVRGEGEFTLAELINALENNMPINTIKGIGYKDKGQLLFTDKREPIKNFDDLPLPAYHLIEMQKYFKFSTMHGMRTRAQQYMQVFTSRGCPYNCIYCHHSEGYRFRPKSPARILEEMNILIQDYGIREFHIEDDTFNVDIKRAKKVMELVASLKTKVHIQFPNGLRADIMDEELADAMKRAGVFLVCIGIETGTARIMQLIQKRLDLSKVNKCQDILIKRRILTWGYFMLGFPSETRAEMRQTIEYAKKSNLHFASFSIVIPFPGTPLWEMIDTNSVQYDQYFRKLNYSSPILTLSEVPAEEMIIIKNKAIKEFFSVWRMMRIASHITNLNDVKYYWRKFLTSKIN